MVALTAAVALALVLSRAAWPYTRMLVTITHEAGHAVAALVAGRRLQGIRLHSDTSGLTVSSGRPSGPGMVAMLLAGYLAPALVGLGAGALLIVGYSLGLLWLLVILLALMLLRIRNFAGFGIIVVVAAGLVAVSWYAPAAGPGRGRVPGHLDPAALRPQAGAGADAGCAGTAGPGTPTPTSWPG